VLLQPRAWAGEGKGLADRSYVEKVTSEYFLDAPESTA